MNYFSIGDRLKSLGNNKTMETLICPLDIFFLPINVHIQDYYLNFFPPPSPHRSQNQRSHIAEYLYKCIYYKKKSNTEKNLGK